MSIVVDSAFGADPKQYRTIEDLDLTEEQQLAVLNYLANQLWVVCVESGDKDWYSKSYDPLWVEHDERTAHSYVFDLGSGGRHHPYTDLADLEQKLRAAAIAWIERNKET